MKKLTAIMLSLVLAISLFGCKSEEAVDITLEDVYGIIQNHVENSEPISGFVSCYISEDDNAIVIEMEDIGEEEQENFIHEVFSNHTGSKFINYIKEHSMLKFEKPDK